MSKCCGCMAVTTSGVLSQGKWRDPQLDEILDLITRNGGNVNAEVLMTTIWKGKSDLDMHLFVPDQMDNNGNLLPNNNVGTIYFSRHKGSRNSWNSGYLDIDANASGNIMANPVENIGFTDVTKMPNGYYMLSINQFNNRSGNGKNKFTILLAFKDRGDRDFTKVLVMNSKFSLDNSNSQHSRDNGGMFDILKFKVSTSSDGNGKDVKIIWLNDGGFDITIKRDIAFV